MTMNVQHAPAVPSSFSSGVPSTIEYKSNGSIRKEMWKFPLEETTLIDFFTDVFENHWQGLRFGPIIPGAAYEMKPPSVPKRVSYNGGYLTVMYHDGGHFHLCLGDFMGSATNPTTEQDRQHRKPSRAHLFRSYGNDDKPNSWGFEMWNGQGEPMISLFFANPFLAEDDSLPEVPDFSRLAAWRSISKRWLGRDAETLDEQGMGFRH